MTSAAAEPEHDDVAMLVTSQGLALALACTFFARKLEIDLAELVAELDETVAGLRAAGAREARLIAVAALADALRGGRRRMQ